MTKNPLYNALAASGYIILLVSAMNFESKIQMDENVASFIMPIIMLSLFTLSAAVMGYIFCYQPLRLFLEGEKEKAVKLFVKTVGIFAIITFSIVLVYLLILRI